MFWTKNFIHLLLCSISDYMFQHLNLRTVHVFILSWLEPLSGSVHPSLPVLSFEHLFENLPTSIPSLMPFSFHFSSLFESWDSWSMWRWQEGFCQLWCLWWVDEDRYCYLILAKNIISWTCGKFPDSHSPSLSLSFSIFFSALFYSSARHIKSSCCCPKNVTLKLNSFTSNHVLRVTHKLFVEEFFPSFYSFTFLFFLRITFFMLGFTFETFVFFLCASKIPSFLNERREENESILVI